MIPQNNRRILVVDDNVNIQGDFRKILTATGGVSTALADAEAVLFGESRHGARPCFEVDGALQGQEAVQLVRDAVQENRPYAMAFVDVRMPPGWDGVETTIQIWKVDPDVQIVICTAFSEHSWDEMIEKLGLSDQLLILKKPFDNIEVLQLASSLTKKWSLLQETKNQMAELERKVTERTSALQAEVRERQQTEEALRQSQEQVLRQERLAVVGRLAAGMAHEFNNLLTVIQGHTSLLLEDETVPDHALVSLRSMAESSERGAKLIREMLAFSRKQVIQTQVLELNSLIESFGQILTRVLGESITLTYHFGQPVVQVKVDPGLVQQALINLAVNARDAMPEGGEFHISTETILLMDTDAAIYSDGRAGEFLCLSISDTGCGMDTSTLKRIFEPFFTTKDVGKGSGLGLASVYGIVRQHAGWIDVASRSGGGTTFRIFLPVNREEAPASPSPPSTRSLDDEADSGSETILVVEDEATVRGLISMVLRRYGYHVLEAASGVQALKICEDPRVKIDLLLTDVVMPGGVSGVALAERLRTTHKDLRVIKSSGYSDEIARHRAFGDQDRFLPKPYDPVKLVRIIREVLDAPAPGTPLSSRPDKDLDADPPSVPS